MQHAINRHLRGCNARHRREQYAAECISQSMPKAAFKWFHHYTGVNRRQRLNINNAGFQKRICLHLHSSNEHGAQGKCHGRQEFNLTRIQFDNQTFFD